MDEKHHYQILTAIVAAGILASWDRGNGGRVFDFDSVVDDASYVATRIWESSSRPPAGAASFGST